MSDSFQEIYDRLLAQFGPQNWWPGDTPFEVLVGAVLTQNTNWQNVEKAIANLKESGLFSLQALLELPAAELAWQIKPSGYYNIKAGRLQNLLQMIADQYEGDLDLLLAEPTDEARQALLSVKGVGPETADSILLYAGGHPIFVVDSYTHRIFSRHQLVDEVTDYHSVQDRFHDQLPRDPVLFNEYHALIVAAAKTYCKKKNPDCENCPLQGI
ncbi:MAG: endonuclease III domain-containing protein [Desulfobulbaceae bacterium]|uniref:Endonuclease III domain-containing protein n=1 Tax=Candidatus Desulfatifera sulfidica TaxID=2841691 RepID=A0A8J6N8Y5_9BACT|nr:endonuclease III domain-containing protein [Candidatus Desulfatifera sulfidica]